MDFSGKTVVITGGTGALGSAVVGQLLLGRRDVPRPLRA